MSWFLYKFCETSEGYPNLQKDGTCFTTVWIQSPLLCTNSMLALGCTEKDVEDIDEASVICKCSVRVDEGGEKRCCNMEIVMECCWRGSEEATYVSLHACSCDHDFGFGKMVPEHIASLPEMRGYDHALSHGRIAGEYNNQVYTSYNVKWKVQFVDECILHRGMDEKELMALLEDVRSRRPCVLSPLRRACGEKL